MKRRKNKSGVGRGCYVRRRPVNGRSVVIGGERRTQATVRMPPDLHRDVVAHALREGETVSNALCHLVEWGLDHLRRLER